MTPEVPHVCRLDALTPSERARHAALVEELRVVRRGVRGLPNGFLFRFPGDPATFARLVEWLTLERRCCPSLDLDLVEDARFSDETILRVTGGPGARAFISAELLDTRDGRGSAQLSRRDASLR